jgi:hypothetical protein
MVTGPTVVFLGRDGGRDEGAEQDDEGETHVNLDGV